MTLITEAETAEDIADAFSKFKVAIPEQATDIAALISELYGIGSDLREIDAAIQSPKYGRNIGLIATDLDLVRSSLTFILGDVFKILGEIGNGSRVLIGDDYRRTWKDIYLHFRGGGRPTLLSRLESYRRFSKELSNIMQRSNACQYRRLSITDGQPESPTKLVSSAVSVVVFMICTLVKTAR